MCIYQKLPTVYAFSPFLLYITICDTRKVAVIIYNTIYRQTKVLLRKFIKDHKYEETLFPRIPVPVQKDMLKKLEEHDKMFQQDTDQSGYGDQGNQAEEYEPPERRDRDYRDNKKRFRSEVEEDSKYDNHENRNKRFKRSTNDEDNKNEDNEMNN